MSKNDPMTTTLAGGLKICEHRGKTRVGFPNPDGKMVYAYKPCMAGDGRKGCAISHANGGNKAIPLTVRVNGEEHVLYAGKVEEMRNIALAVRADAEVEGISVENALAVALGVLNNPVTIQAGLDLGRAETWEISQGDQRKRSTQAASGDMLDDKALAALLIPAKQ